MSAHELKKGKVFFRIEEWRDAGFPTRELREGGYTASELMACGYRVAELRKHGFSIRELVESGIEIAELRAIGASLSELREVGFSARALREVGYPVSELLAVGFNAKELIECGFGVTELREAGKRLEDPLALDSTSISLWAGSHTMVCRNACCNANVRRFQRRPAETTWVLGQGSQGKWTQRGRAQGGLRGLRQAHARRKMKYLAQSNATSSLRLLHSFVAFHILVHCFSPMVPSALRLASACRW